MAFVHSHAVGFVLGYRSEGGYHFLRLGQARKDGQIELAARGHYDGEGFNAVGFAWRAEMVSARQRQALVLVYLKDNALVTSGRAKAWCNVSFATYLDVCLFEHGDTSATPQPTPPAL